MGGLYGTVAEHAPRPRIVAGVPFGTVLSSRLMRLVFLLSDCPSLGGEYSLSTHASLRAAHIVYRVTTEICPRT
jgi:hypothetical protein